MHRKGSQYMFGPQELGNILRSYVTSPGMRMSMSASIMSLANDPRASKAIEKFLNRLADAIDCDVKFENPGPPRAGGNGRRVGATKGEQ